MRNPKLLIPHSKQAKKSDRNEWQEWMLIKNEALQEICYKMGENHGHLGGNYSVLPTEAESS